MESEHKLSDSLPSREGAKVQSGVAETTEKRVAVDLRESLGPTPADIERDPAYTAVANQDSEIADLREQLARQQALRRDLERELAESRSRQRELERRLNGVTRTFTYRLGETLVAGRSIKGLLAMPGRFWRMWTDWLEKRRMDRLRPEFGQTPFAEQLSFVGEILDVHQADGLAAARKAAAALPASRPREKARALVELAHVALGEDQAASLELAGDAARLNAAEPRLKALAFRLFDQGEVSAAAQILEAGRDLEFHPGDLPRRQSLAAYTAWRSGVALGPARAGAPRTGGVLVVDALSGPRPDHARRRAEAVAADYAARGLPVVLAGGSTEIPGVRPLALRTPLAAPAALDLLADERAAALKAAIAAEDIGLVHASGDLVSAIAAARAARATGARFVLDIDRLPALRRQRGPAWDGSEGFRICSQVLKDVAGAADLLVARSPALARAVAEITGKAPDVVLADAPMAGRTPTRLPALTGLDPTDKIVLLPRLSEAEPRSLAVVEAIAEVARAFPTVRLVPVGAGRDFGPLRQRAHDLGVKDRLIAADAGRGAIEDLVARAHVLLLDDADTGLSGLFSPPSIAEARHLGAPIVAIAGTWAEGLLDKRDAWLADPNNPSDLALQIASALRAEGASPKLKRARERGEEEVERSRAAFGEGLARLGF